jgi:hypothetical protein
MRVRRGTDSPRLVLRHALDAGEVSLALLDGPLECLLRGAFEGQRVKHQIARAAGWAFAFIPERMADGCASIARLMLMSNALHLIHHYLMRAGSQVGGMLAGLDQRIEVTHSVV